MLGKQRLRIGRASSWWVLSCSARSEIRPIETQHSASPPPRCEVSVTADVLNVRSGPDAGTPVIDQLGAGEVAEAGGTIRNGFRQMSEGRWASAQFLTETPGSDCD